MDKNSYTTPLNRFSNRAQNYARYRASYPATIVSFLEEILKLKAGDRIVDIGSGTGLFTELLLKQGYSVTGIETNDDMRLAGEQRLKSYLGFDSCNRHAQDTGLAARSVDLITVAQAFHWPDAAAVKKEFFRILKPARHIVFGWNTRKNSPGFPEKFELLKKSFSTKRQPLNKIDEEAIHEFMYPGRVRSGTFPSTQWLDFDSLKGQLLSSSYIPLPGHPSYDAMISALVSLFVHNNENGFVRMEYETKLYWNV